ncbi:hypothetical protein J7426_21820 [Tropicibacter sp. R16_0]|uniref:hypothetical protein n=1 Tax=Tropicibacter sp. R16_0 TaxID=2821102 RepID=UPI001ADBE413|nr:hypothetical protein [Tropicibacter sp. R16_0]MBO9452917.1 hypothetical protein [Tropicibacter sp. R16_0]
MSTPNTVKSTELIEQQATEHCLLFLPEGSLPYQVMVRRVIQDARSQLWALFAEWPIAKTPIQGVSFVFTDKPFELSRLLIDAVVVADGAEFKRVEATDLPGSFYAALARFEDRIQSAIVGQVGNAVATMAERYGHQLHSGQAYLTLDTLTVMNICGKTQSGLVMSSSTLPYAVTTLLTGTAEEAMTHDPECCEPRGTPGLADWILRNKSASRVNQQYLKACFRNLRRSFGESQAMPCHATENSRSRGRAVSS